MLNNNNNNKIIILVVLGVLCFYFGLQIANASQLSSPSYSASTTSILFIPPTSNQFQVTHGGSSGYHSNTDPDLKVNLPKPFTFFGKQYNSLFMYIDGAVTFVEKIDATPCSHNSCHGTSPSIFALFGSAGGNDYLNGEAQYQFYSSCPRASISITGNEACSIVTWTDVQFGGNLRNTFQTILYHSSSDIILQYLFVAFDDNQIEAVVFPAFTGSNANDFIQLSADSTLTGKAYVLHSRSFSTGGTTGGTTGTATTLIPSLLLTFLTVFLAIQLF